VPFWVGFPAKDYAEIPANVRLVTWIGENRMNAPLPTDTQAENTSRLDLAACLIIVFFLIFLAWFGTAFHYVEMCYSTEYDRYVEQADQLLRGILPKDPYHPLFYPLLAAAMGKLLGDTFQAAKCISTLSAVGVLSVTYLIGLMCFGRRTALLATLALALNSLVIMCGFEAGTDMLFAFLGLSCMLLSVRLLERPAMITVLLLGVCFALAYFTRYAAVALVPCLFLTLWWCPLPNRAKRLVRGLALTVTIAICLAPHFALTAHIFGSPLHSRQGDNLSRKVMHLRPDLQAASGTMDTATLLKKAPFTVVLTAADSARGWIVDGVAGFVGGNRVFLASAFFTVTVLGGLLGCFLSADRRVLLLLLYIASYFVVICLSMEPLPRLLLPILPLCMLVAVFFMVEDGRHATFSFKGISVPSGIAAVVLFLALLPAGAFHAVSDMVLRHPYQELEAARNLENASGKSIVVAGTFPFLQRYVGYRYYHLTADFGSKGPHESLDYFRKLGPTLKDIKADYIIVGTPSLGSRPVELLTGQNLPVFLKPEFLEGDLSVYRVLKDRL
jgi:4-amino-4-deoxy-L-arabinose transferase-like glycosyltransferase